MTTIKKILFSLILSSVALVGCKSTQPQEREPWVTHALSVAEYQLTRSAINLKDSLKMPRSTYTGYDIKFLEKQVGLPREKFTRRLWPNYTANSELRIRMCEIEDWTSGFFPGSMWYTYEMTGSEGLILPAEHYTKMLNPLRYHAATHDIGFMVNCSFGNAYRINPQDSVKQIIIETADNLCTRFDPTIKSIRSWDFGAWNFPVIIDNMMNLDLLFTASKLSGNKKYYDVAVAHARTTMEHHFRPDYTSYHVVSYNDDGSVESRGTHQGLSDDSAWSRGQGWAVYGFVSCYRETKMVEFLDQATHVADMIIERNVPADKIPYWDFDAIDSAETPRDASAAAVIASAFFELSTMVSKEQGKIYFDYALDIIKSLSSEEYLAEMGENFGYILKHSVGSLPHGSEIDTPLNYADYYYLEAMKRYLDLIEK